MHLGAYEYIVFLLSHLRSLPGSCFL